MALSEEDLWQAWFDTRSVAARNALVENFYPYARTHSWSWSRRTGFPVDEYMSWSVIGLINAVETWDKESSSFHTWANRKMHWAVVDGLRETTTYSRVLHDAIGEYMGFLDKWYRENDTRPSYPDTMTALGWSMKRVREISRIVYQFSHLKHYSAEQYEGENLSGDKQEAKLPFTPGADTYAMASIMQDQLTMKMMDYLSQLPENGKVVLHFFYYEGWPMKRIGEEILGVSESRVSQIHTSCLKMLRVLMTKANEGFDELVFTDVAHHLG